MEDCEDSDWVLMYVDYLFFELINSETGDFLRLPCEGTVLQQPWRLWNFCMKCQMIYKKVLSEKVRAMRG